MGVRLVTYDHADGLETGGSMAAADLLVVARRAYRTKAIRAGQFKARATGVRFGRPPMPPSRLERVRAALQSGQGVGQTARSTGLSAAKVSRTRAEMAGAGLMGMTGLLSRLQYRIKLGVGRAVVGSAERR
jgi:hypothetical protein